jgi:DNA-binding transcriptional LysR family regulator
MAPPRCSRIGGWAVFVTAAAMNQVLGAVRTHGTGVITDATLAPDLAVAGAGIAYLFEALVREDLLAGRLVGVLPDTAWQEEGPLLYFPRRASQSAKLKAFIAQARALRA